MSIFPLVVQTSPPTDPQFGLALQQSACVHLDAERQVFSAFGKVPAEQEGAPLSEQVLSRQQMLVEHDPVVQSFSSGLSIVSFCAFEQKAGSEDNSSAHVL